MRWLICRITWIGGRFSGAEGEKKKGISSADLELVLESLDPPIPGEREMWENLYDLRPSIEGVNSRPKELLNLKP